MQKLRAFTILLFVSFAMILESCAEDETLNEVETTLEMGISGEDDPVDSDDMDPNDEDDQVDSDGM